MKATYALFYFYIIGIAAIVVGAEKHIYAEIPIAISILIIVNALYLTRPRGNG